MMLTTGTKEWSTRSENLFIGCAHNCRYCYAKPMLINRRKFTTTLEWPKMRPNAVMQKALDSGGHFPSYSKKKGVIMFPTTHDLVPLNRVLTPSLDFLESMLQGGNDVLVVTKPHTEVVSAIIGRFREYIPHLELRFTIGSNDDSVLKYWEPGAPSFRERFSCLTMAYNAGFTTSVSMEPCLMVDPMPLICELAPFVKTNIWVGRMNRCPEATGAKLDFISNKTVLAWHHNLKDLPIIKFKDSVLDVLDPQRVVDRRAAKKAAAEEKERIKLEKEQQLQRKKKRIGDEKKKKPKSKRVKFEPEPKPKPKYDDPNRDTDSEPELLYCKPVAKDLEDIEDL